jgi:hypothetical protein
MPFKTSLGETIFKQKYASNPYETWEDRAHIVVNWVCGDMNGDKNNLMAKSDRDELTQQISEFKFMPGGRYLWYSGRDARFFNNCYLLRLEDDSREEWAGRCIELPSIWSSTPPNWRRSVRPNSFTVYLERGRKERNAGWQP